MNSVKPYDGHKDPANCRFCGGKGWGMIGIDWERPDPGKAPYRGDIITCPCCLGRGLVEYCRYDCQHSQLELADLLASLNAAFEPASRKAENDRKPKVRKGWKRTRP